MNGFEVIHGWNATDHTVLLVYNTSMGMKIFTFWLPGWCEWHRFIYLNTPSQGSDSDLYIQIPPARHTIQEAKK